MPETSISTILSDWLSEYINPYHLNAWLSLHFGKGAYYVNGHFLKGVFNADGTPKKVYKIYAPREIREVSTIPQVWRENLSVPLSKQLTKPQFEVVPLWEFEVRDSGRVARKVDQKSEASNIETPTLAVDD